MTWRKVMKKDQFIVTVNNRFKVPKRWLEEYIREAVQTWKGQMHPDELIFNMEWEDFKVRSIKNPHPPSVAKERARMHNHITWAKNIIFLTALLAGCGSGAQSSPERISCAQMAVLQQQGLLPPSQADQNAVRLLFAQAVADELALGAVSTPMSYCDY